MGKLVRLRIKIIKLTEDKHKWVSKHESIERLLYFNGSIRVISIVIFQLSHTLPPSVASRDEQRLLNGHSCHRVNSLLYFLGSIIFVDFF